MNVCKMFAETRSEHWVTEPHQLINIKLSESGFGAREPTTVVRILKNTVRNHGTRPALFLKRAVHGVLPDDYKVWTWNQYYEESRMFAKSLIFLKVETFKCTNILGFNSPEWFIANTGSILAGCVAAGIYTTNLAEACHYISNHSMAEVVVVEGNKQLEKYTNTSLGYLKAIVVWGEPVDEKIASRCRSPVHSWEAFLKLGESTADEELDRRGDSMQPGNCASLIYTSGTTGPPKAVMISHDNITWTGANICEGGYMDLNHEDCVISYLPLSHIAAQLIDIHCMMYLGGSVYFAQPDALKGSLGVTMKEVRPTFFFGVPRVWEKIQEKMVSIGRESTGIKKWLATWAKGCGAEKTRLAQFGNGGGAPFGYGCANSIILSRIKEALGLQRSKGCFTAAAPIASETLLYFGSLDIPVYEVFGQSECTGPHTVSAAKAWKIGTCGRPIRGSQSMIVASNGELCYRGRHIFMGYMYDRENTAATIDGEGYLHSGDVAEFDADQDKDVVSPSGFMKITGRIKELIITAGGENVPPVLIENEMKAQMVALSNVMVIGDKKKFLTMLVSLKVEIDKETAEPTDRLAADSLFVGGQIGSTAALYSEAKRDPLWKKYIDDGMKAANKKTASQAQIVQKWTFLPVDFCEKNGELTPTLKLKRNVATRKYEALIDSLYGDDGQV